MFNKFLHLAFISTAVAAISSGSAHAAVPNDFDKDGVSDVTWVETGSDKSLTWKTTYSSNGQTAELGKLGKSDDKIAMAQWFGDGTQIGVVSLTSDKTVQLSVIDPSGNRVDKEIGKKGDLIVSGADFNGNGIADVAAVRLVSGKAEWQVWYDIFSSAAGSPTSFTYGAAGDRVFFARADDTPVDWIGLMRKGAGRKSQARFKNLVTSDIKTFTRLPAFASTGSRPRAIPVRQGSGADVLAFNVGVKKNTEVRVYTLSGVELDSAAFQGTGDAVPGDYTAGGAYEVAFKGSDDAGIFSPGSGEIGGNISASGMLVGEVNINTIGAAASSSSGGSGGTVDPGAGGGSLASCSRALPWPGSYIYKTVGSHHFTDVRRNTFGLVLKVGAPGPFPGCVSAVDKNGKVLAKLGLYAMGAGWQARYYAGIGCGSSNPINGAALASRARSSSGSQYIYMNMGGTCYGPIDATQCVGSKAC